MSKVIIILTKITIALLITLLFSSCRYQGKMNDSMEGSGNFKTETRTLPEDFQKISVENTVEVTVEQSDNKSINVEADDNIINHVVTKVENGVLIIKLESGSYDNVSAKVNIKMPVIKGLYCSSSSSIKGNNVIITDDLDVKAESDGDVELNVEADNLSLTAESSGSIKARGKALKLKTSSNSGSDLNAKELMANEVISQSESGGSSSVYPIVSLNASASSGGSIIYYKSPKSITKESSSGGSISRM